jgi:modulator of FtsH protease HflC
MNLKIVVGILVAVIVALGLSCAYTVDETEQVVITLFSKVNRTVLMPGLHFKFPIVEHKIAYPNNLQEWDGDPGEIPTKDKTYIYVDTFARWKIVDPVLFFRTIGPDAKLAPTLRLNEIIDPAVRNLITSNRLIETVRNSNRELDTFEEGISTEDLKKQPSNYMISIGRNKIDEMILKQAQPKLKKFGIDLVDVKIKRINYREEVRQSVYDRMIAERKQIAQKFRSEGKGEAQKILGDKELDLKRIKSEAYRTAQGIKGKADAESTKLYAEAFGKDPEFYSFVKTLEIYGEALDKDSSLVLSTDSDLLKYLKGYSDKK